MVCALLAGCSGPGAPSPAAASLTVQPKLGLRLNTGFVEFGDFTAFDEKLQWIDGCNEIPREVLEAAGMDLSRGVDTTKENTGLACTLGVLEPSKRYASVTLGADSNPENAYQKLGYVITPSGSGAQPAMYVHRSAPPGVDKSCEASVDTRRGRFAVSYSDYSAGKTQEMNCQQAADLMNRILNSIGGTNGNQR